MMAWLAFFFAAVAVFAWRALKRQRAKRSLDAQLPGALFSMALFDASVPLETVFARLAAHSPKPAADVFSFLSGQLSGGIGFERAVRAACRRFESVLLPRVSGLWLAAYRGGADLSHAYRRVAEDAAWFLRLSREREQAFAVQRYTLYAGALLVPGLLGWLYTFSAKAPSALSSAVFLGLHAYLAAFGILAGVLIALMGPGLSRALPYALSLAPVAVLVFRFSAGVLI